MIDNTKQEIKALHSRIEDDFSVWFTDAQHLAVLVNSCIEMPRVIVRQAHRANAESSTTKEYFLRNVAIHFLDYNTSELNTRFSEHNRAGKIYQNTSLMLQT